MSHMLLIQIVQYSCSLHAPTDIGQHLMYAHCDVDFLTWQWWRQVCIILEFILSKGIFITKLLAWFFLCNCSNHNKHDFTERWQWQRFFSMMLPLFICKRSTIHDCLIMPVLERLLRVLQQLGEHLEVMNSPSQN